MVENNREGHETEKWAVKKLWHAQAISHLGTRLVKERQKPDSEKNSHTYLLILNSVDPHRKNALKNKKQVTT